MKSRHIYTLILAAIFISFGCSSSGRIGNQITDDQIIIVDKGGNQSISVSKGKAFDHPTIAIWAEDSQGNYLETIYVTNSYASGIYSFEMVGDTSWLSNPGPSYQPAALPYWTHKKGLIKGKTLIPTVENPFVDAYSGPTPVGNFTIKSEDSFGKPFRILLEVNQFGDWNKYWINNKYPNSKAYGHSAQPSVIYSVTITQHDTVFYLNPIGHGDPEGTSGKLFTDLSTLTTALEILEQIKVTTK